MTTGGRGAPQRAVWLTAVLLATRAAEASYDVRSVAAIIGGRPIVELNDHKKAVFVPIDTASVSQLGEANPSDRCIATACWAICHPKAPDVVTTAAQRHDAQCSKMWQKVGVFEVADALRAEDTFASYSHLLAGAQLHTLPREFWRLAYFDKGVVRFRSIPEATFPLSGYPVMGLAGSPHGLEVCLPPAACCLLPDTYLPTRLPPAACRLPPAACIPILSPTQRPSPAFSRLRLAPLGATPVTRKASLTTFTPSSPPRRCSLPKKVSSTSWRGWISGGGSLVCESDPA